MTGVMRNKGIALVAVVLSGAGVLMYARPMAWLFRGAYRDDTFSYIVIIPFIAIYLIYQARKGIFSIPRPSPVPGVVLLSLGILLYFVAVKEPVEPSASLAHYSLYALSTVLYLGGILGLFAGAGGLWAARFPMMFLFFLIPIPGMILTPIVRFLQAGSAEVSYWVIRLLGVPILREGFQFFIPGLSVEVAEQCSGIRSSLSLLLAGLLAGNFFLKSGWRKLALVAAVVPITIVKNGLRIVTVTLLASYVDRRILSGPLHTVGGIPFFLVALSMLGAVLWLLRRGD